ncbi:MAG: GNAT family N-acetyltransferase [Planctomycetaceae bacterium]
MRIVEKRVHLRPARPEDKRAIFQALARSDLTDTLLGHPSQSYTPLFTLEAFCADYEPHYFDGSDPERGRCFIIEVNGQVVGQVNYNDIDRASNITELDIWMFGERFCGHGYGSEALGLLCEHLRKNLNIRGFYVKPSVANPRAIRSYEKAGFQRTRLSDDEAVRRFGPKEAIDTIFMTKDLEHVVPPDRSSSPRGK